MPIYEYKAFAPGGSTKSGIVDADSERDARSKLRKDKLLVSKLTETRSGRRVKKSKFKDKDAPAGKQGALAGLRAARAASQGPGAGSPTSSRA